MPRRSFSRRDLLLSGGALALSGIAGAAWTRERAYDVVVVGAGVAGIAAARTLRAAGASVLVLEAARRIGGRVAGVVLTGASRGQSDLQALVARLGIATVAATAIRTRWNRGDASFAPTYAAMLTALIERGERLREGSEPDERAYEAVRAFRDRDGFREALAALAIRSEGRYPASLLDYHLVAGRAASPFVFPADDTLLVPAGLESVLARLSAGVPMVLGAPVASIDHRDDGATLRTEGGQTFRSRQAIVTASTGDLASGSIVFSPALPAKMAAAVAALPMGIFGGAASSYATVGNAGARGLVAQPIGGTLRFAGEATAPPGFGCVEGAWESGAAAARAALAA